MADGDLKRAGDAEDVKPTIDELNGLSENLLRDVERLTSTAEKQAAVLANPNKIQGPNDRAYADERSARAAQAVVTHLNGLSAPTRAVFDGFMALIGYSKDA